MDATALARSLLAPVPAHRTLGIEVQQASDGVATVTLATPPAMTNVIGSLHSSGLIALVDATGLAAIIAACEAETEFERILPLGSAASMEFRAPARGRLTGSCGLGEDARAVLRPVLAGRQDRARLSTHAEVVDEQDALVCRGTFEWSVRRLPDAG